MAKTVDELRDEIRVAVGRHERIESTAFTKEALAAICGALGADVEGDRLPPKSAMRERILRRVDADDAAPDVDPDDCDRPFRKAELQAVAAALGET